MKRNGPTIVLAQILVACAARLVPGSDRARWREEWLGELDAIAARGAGQALRFALGAPRDAWSLRPPARLLSAVMADCRYAARQLLRRPAHTVAVIACLVVGLVASVAMFSIITSLFYGDMPGIAQRKELLRLYVGYDRARSFETNPDGSRVVAERPSFSDFAIARDISQAPAIDVIGAEGSLRMTAAGAHGPISVTGAFASGDFFRVLRTVPVTGRFFTDADDRLGAEPVAVVTDYFWRTHLDADPAAMGRPILVGGQSFAVVGVAPPRFHGIQLLDDGQDDSNGVQVWVPLAYAPSWPTHPSLSEPWLQSVARLKPGAALIDAERQIGVVAARIAAAEPDRRAGASASLRPMGFVPTSSFKMLALVALLLALPLTILAIGCANVANLQLARAAEQARELAVRLALGATRTQLVRMLTIETLARVVAATTLSIGIIILLLGRLEGYFPIFITIDWRVMSFAAGLALLVGLATGLVPAWLVLRRTAAGQLRQDARSGGLGHARLRAGLVVAQVALSLTLLILTGLFARTAHAMVADAPPALREQLVANFDPGELGMSPVQARQFAAALADRSATDARASAVSLSTEDAVRFGQSDRPAASDQFATLVGLTPSWLEVMDAPLQTGRRLTADDDGSVAMISARAAEIIAPNASPLGLLLRVDLAGAAERRVRVVGVVGDLASRPTVDRPGPVIYTTFPAEVAGPFTLRLRSTHPEALEADLRRVISAVDPRITWTSLRRGDMAFEDDAREMRSAIYGVGVAALVALVLSATGLYAVMSYVVLLRRREIGVRLAVGAEPGRIVAMVMRQSFTLVGIGMAIGLSLSIPMAVLMRATFVARVPAFDPLAFLPTAGLLLAAGVAASVVPALRASRVDPIATLRQD